MVGIDRRKPAITMDMCMCLRVPQPWGCAFEERDDFEDERALAAGGQRQARSASRIAVLAQPDPSTQVCMPEMYRARFRIKRRKA